MTGRKWQLPLNRNSYEMKHAAALTPSINLGNPTHIESLLSPSPFEGEGGQGGEGKPQPTHINSQTFLTQPAYIHNASAKLSKPIASGGGLL